jgi:hypothetical protein
METMYQRSKFKKKVCIMKRWNIGIPNHWVNTFLSSKDLQRLFRLR